MEAFILQVWGIKDPLKELKDFKHNRGMETYIQNFDIMWNRADFSKKEALVFFMDGLEVEIENLVKIFELKVFKLVYNLAHLQENTLSHYRNL